MRTYLLSFSILVCLLFFSMHGRVRQHRLFIWNDELNHKEIEERLTKEKVVDTQDFRIFLRECRNNRLPTHKIVLVTLESGLQGLFKKGRLHYAEVAGFRASKVLGLRLVPPTVFRTINGVSGSLQMYVDAPDLSRNSSNRRIRRRCGKKVISDMKIFYYLFGQWDVHGGNRLLTEDSLVLIDNSTLLSRTHQQYGKSGFKSSGDIHIDKSTHDEPYFPYEHARTIPGGKVASVFGPYMAPYRVERYSEEDFMTYIIWKNRLYVQFTKYDAMRFTDEIYKSTFTAIKRLTYKDMLYVWREHHKESPDHTQELIQLTLERRDSLVDYFKKYGTILA